MQDIGQLVQFAIRSISIGWASGPVVGSTSGTIDLLFHSLCMPTAILILIIVCRLMIIFFFQSSSAALSSFFDLEKKTCFLRLHNLLLKFLFPQFSVPWFNNMHFPGLVKFSVKNEMSSTIAIFFLTLFIFNSLNCKVLILVL